MKPKLFILLSIAIPILALLLGRFWMIEAKSQADLNSAAGYSVEAKQVSEIEAGLNIVYNGNFEEPDVEAITFDTYFGGQSFGGWTVESGSIDHISELYWQAADG